MKLCEWKIHTMHKIYTIHKSLKEFVQFVLKLWYEIDRDEKCDYEICVIMGLICSYKTNTLKVFIYLYLKFIYTSEVQTLP